MDCIFCAIISRRLPATIISEDQHCIVIKDIAPKAPIHYLLIPKKHIASLYELQADDMHLISHMTSVAQQLGKQTDGFTLAVNNGAAVGQIVFHLHYHFLSGAKSQIR